MTQCRPPLNSLNRLAALLNVLNLCPPQLTPLVIRLTYYIDGETTLSTEGTTRGDLLAMAMDAIGVKYLLQYFCLVD